MDYQAVEYVDIRETEMRTRPFAWRGVEEKIRQTEYVENPQAYPLEL